MNLLKRLARLEDTIRPTGLFVIDGPDDYAMAKEHFNFVGVLERINQKIGAVGEAFNHEAVFGDRPNYEELVEQGVFVETKRYRESNRKTLQDSIEEIR